MKGIFLRSVPLLIFMLVLSCSNNNEDGVIVQISYGTSFGECIGYCKKDLIIKPGRVIYSRSSWYPVIRTITNTNDLGENDWSFFKTNILLSPFLNLPKIIGCPDCADGGAEWIEIELDNGVKHKVTFEYHNEPSVVKSYIVELRKLLDDFENSHLE